MIKQEPARKEHATESCRKRLKALPHFSHLDSDTIYESGFSKLDPMAPCRPPYYSSFPEKHMSATHGNKL